MSSLIELILEQQAILISLGVVGLVILLAVAIVVGVQLRKVMAKMAVMRAQHKAEAARRAAAAAARKQAARARKRHADEAADEQESLAPTTLAGLAAFAEVPVEAAPTTEATPDAPSPDAAAPAVTVLPATATTSADTATPEESQTTDAMKDLLSSVFFDEGAQERFENLLRGYEAIDIDTLAQFSQQVANQLRNVLPAASGS